MFSYLLVALLLVIISGANCMAPNSTIMVGKPKKKIHLDFHNIYPERVENLLNQLERNYKDIFKVTVLGHTFGHALPMYAVEISSNVQKPRKFLKPMFKFVANIQGDDVVGYTQMVY